MFKNIFLDPDTGAGAGGAGDAGDPPDPNAVPKFSQNDLNKIQAADKRKLKEQNENLVRQLEEVKQSQTLSQQEREALQGQIETLQQTYLTKEEQAKIEQGKAQKKYEKERTDLETEMKKWRNAYTESSIENAITSAAAEHEAFSATQIVALLRPMTQLAEDISEDGKATGKYVPKVAYPTVGKDGPVTLTLTTAEAVKAMKEDTERFGNLFKSNLKGGVGGQGNQSGKSSYGDLRKPENWVKYREANPNFENLPRE